MGIATILLIAAIALAAIGFLIGLGRGLGRSALRLATLLLVFVLVFFLSQALAKNLVDKDISGLVKEVDGVEVTSVSETIHRLISDNETLAPFLENNVTLQNFIDALPVFLLSLVLFYVLTIVGLLISLILYWLISLPVFKIAFKDKKKTAGSRLSGALVGLVAGLLVFSMLLVPVLGLTTLSDKMMSGNGENTPEVLKDIKDNYYDPTMSSPIVSVLKTIGMDKLGVLFLKNASAFKAKDNSDLTIVTEAEPVLELYSILQEKGLLNFGSEESSDAGDIFSSLADREFTERLINVMMDSKVLVDSIPAIASYSGKMIAQSLSLPVDKEEAYQMLTEKVASLINENSEELELLHAVEQFLSGNYISVDTPTANLTVTDGDFEGAQSQYIRFRLIPNGPIYITERNTGNGQRNIAKVASDQEERKTFSGEMLPVTEVTQKVEEVVAKVENLLSGNTKNGKDNTDGMKKAAANIVDEVKKTIAENNTPSPSGQPSQPVQSVQIENILNSDAVQEASLKKEAFEYNGITGQDISDKMSESMETLLNSDKEAATQTLVDIIIPLAETLPGMLDEESPSGIIDPSIANVLSVIRDNEALHGIGTTLLDAVAQSDSLKDVLPEATVETLKEVYEDKEADIGKVATVAISAANVVIVSNQETTNEEEKAKQQEAVSHNIETMILSLDESTVSTVQSLITVDFIASLIDGSTENAQTAKTVVDEVLVTLSKTEDQSDFKRESEAIASLYNMIKNVDTLEAHDLIEFASFAEESKILRDVLKSCTAYSLSVGADKKAGYESELKSAYNKSTYAKNIKDQVYNDLATILGLDISF